MHDKRFTRRSLLRSAVIGGAGLAAASIAGCGDDEEAASTVTPTSDATPTNGATGTSTPAPTGDATPTATAGQPSVSWELVPVTGDLPAARRDHSLVTDGQVLYLFGGRSGVTNLDDLWQFDPAAGAWTELAIAPPARFGHNAVYLPDQQEVIVFGGQAGTAFLNDTWAYSPAGGEWTERTPATAPSARYGAAAALDPQNGLVVTHGFTTQGRFDDTWAFADASWSDVSASGQRPEARCLTRAAWDAQNERLLMFGGQSNTTPFLGDLWAYNNGAWIEINQSGDSPSPRNFYAMAATDPSQVVLFGGRTEDGDQNDVWFLDTTKELWVDAGIPGESPSPRNGHDAVFVPSERALYVFGGQDESGALNDLWRLTVGS